VKQVTPNVFVENALPFCNLGLVTTSEGIVAIDTPINPSDSVKWREEINKRGKLLYLIITEEHPDHSSNGWFFPGLLITSQEARDKLSRQSAAGIIESVKRSDPAGVPFMESFQLRLADITFTENLSLHLSKHTFNLFPLTGHATGGIGVYIPEERVVFASDCVFNRCKSWLHESEPDQWLDSLRRIGELDPDTIVPGHGATCGKDYLKEQERIIREWVEAVKSAIKRGLSEGEAVARIPCPDPYPKQPGTPMTDAELNKAIITRLYRLYSGK
jgi:cyclase